MAAVVNVNDAYILADDNGDTGIGVATTCLIQKVSN